MIQIANHAIERYQERVANVPRETVIARLSTPTILLAIAFGAEYVRLGSGHRVVIRDGAIISVLPADHFRRQIARQGTGRYNHSSPKFQNTSTRAEVIR